MEVMKMGAESVKVNCDFCGKQIECPKDMVKDFKWHMCFECFQNPSIDFKGKDASKIHIDIPRDKFNEFIPEFMLDNIMREVFPGVWQERKNELKDLSKKQLSEEMFAAGVSTAFDMMKQLGEEYEKQIEKESEK